MVGVVGKSLIGLPKGWIAKVPLAILGRRPSKITIKIKRIIDEGSPKGRFAKGTLAILGRRPSKITLQDKANNGRRIAKVSHWRTGG